MRDDDRFRDLAHGFPRVHALYLDAAERLLFLQSVLVHKNAFCAVDRLTGLKLVLQIGGLFLNSQPERAKIEYTAAKRLNPAKYADVVDTILKSL